MVPIRFGDRALVRPTSSDIAETGDRIRAIRGQLDGYDLVVWAEVARIPAEVAELAAAYEKAGATWWIETARPEPGWWQGITDRVAAGV